MFRPTVLLALEVGGIYALLGACGYWMARLYRRWSGSLPAPPAALLGLATLQGVAWYASTLDIGLDRVWPWLVASAVVGAAVVLVVEHRPLTWKLFEVRHRRELSVDVLVALLSFVVFVLQSDDLLARGALSIASRSVDAPNYVAVADHLSRAGLHTAGSIYGVDLGVSARTDVHGAVSYLSAAEWICFRPGFQVVLAAIAVAAILIAQALARLLCRWTQLPIVAVACLAVLPQTTFLFAYISTMYFLAQLLGVAFAVTMLDLATRPCSARREGAVTVLGVGAVCAGLVLTYPHMTFLVPFIVVPAMAVLHGWNWRGLMSSLMRFAGGLALGMLVMLPRTRIALDRLLILKDAKAGWTNDGVLPWGLIGRQRGFEGTVTVVTIVGSVVVVGLSLAAAGWLAYRREQAWARAAVMVMGCCLGSYAVIYFFRGGPTYEQWKWISFFQPLVVTAILAPVLVALIWRSPRYGSMLVVVFLLSLGVLNLRSSMPYTSTVALEQNWVPPELGAIGDDPALRGIASINVDLDPYWESMWAANALVPRRVYVLAPTYYGLASPVAGWTLTRSPPTAGSGRVQEVRSSAGGNYFVVRAPPIGPNSRSAQGVAATLNARFVPGAAAPGAAGHVSATVTNLGTSTLLSSGVEIGAVNIGVQFVDENGAVVDVTRAVLSRAPYVVSPGQTVTVEFDLPPLPAGASQVEFDLVAEGVAWFGDIGASNVVTLEAPRG